ncbi:electron transport complex subunit RsxB [Aliagarivorans taiwanensis]|uniref:electron transport complex subunit RsxB n=1 Tax=Aliagarivorans taiwanensis TaxID=561966 RepID=UPI0004234A77|nr:electron transport complex subunit RsxB [Aliagarivorans taiwanensis]
MIEAIIALTVLAAIFGGILGFAAIRYRVEGDPIADQVEQLLPQTQCGQCGHPGCRPYAEAIAKGEAINKCPPGGQETVEKLADLLGVEVPELDASAQEKEKPKSVAFIHEEACIGCTKCIQACPVDAIVGANKQMHTIITKECTGCELCVAPCPTDCIEMRPIAQTSRTWDWQLNKIDIAVIDVASGSAKLEEADNA